MKPPIRRHMGSSSPNFFYHLSSSHGRGFESWDASYLGHMALSNGKDPLHSWILTCQALIGEIF